MVTEILKRLTKYIITPTIAAAVFCSLVFADEGLYISKVGLDAFWVLIAPPPVFFIGPANYRTKIFSD